MEMDIATAAALLDIKYAGEGATDTKALLRSAKAAYRKLALKYHPDKNGGSRKAQIMFVKVGIAYKTIIEALQNESLGEFEEEGGLYVDEDDLEVLLLDITHTCMYWHHCYHVGVKLL